jgi:CMP-N-acetylneuraminic acid synthetase
MRTDCATLAVVIGRAGSKGLPGKNARALAGRPLVCHTIGAALAAATVDRVVVSTDCADIATATASMSVPVGLPSMRPCVMPSRPSAATSRSS